jgi:hypothetical protein
MWLATLAVVPTRTTVLVPADMPELARAASAIAFGRVVDVSARLEPGTRRIESVVTLAVDDYYKGNLGDDLQISVPGGQLGHYRTVMVGAPEFSAGEQVILFVATRGDGLPYVVGLNQGAFRVSVDVRSGRRVVSPAPLVRPPGARGAVALVRGDATRQPMALDEFVVEVRRALGAGGTREPRRQR